MKFLRRARAICRGNGLAPGRLPSKNTGSGGWRCLSSHTRRRRGVSTRRAVDVEPLTVISNPPFAITGPWLAAMLDQGFPRKLALLLQKEAVERITAKSGNKHFGVLAIRLGAAYEVAGVHPVPRRVFIRLRRLIRRSWYLIEKQMVSPFRRSFSNGATAFYAASKQIGAKLRSLLQAETLVLWEQVLQHNGLNLQSRPEQIPTTVWTS